VTEGEGAALGFPLLHRNVKGARARADEVAPQPFRNSPKHPQLDRLCDLLLHGTDDESDNANGTTKLDFREPVGGSGMRPSTHGGVGQMYEQCCTLEVPE